MIDSHDDVRTFALAVVGLSWVVAMAVCGWLYGLVSFDATMLGVSFVVMTVGCAVGYVVLVRSLVAELDGVEPTA